MFREDAGMGRKVVLVIRNGEGMHRQGDGMVRKVTGMNKNGQGCSGRVNE